MTITDPLLPLRAFLDSVQPGPIECKKGLYDLLADNWPYLDVISNDGGMRGGKIHGKPVNITWNPPVLSFQIKGHGGTMEHWEIDVEKRTRNLVGSGHQQV